MTRLALALVAILILLVVLHWIDLNNRCGRGRVDACVELYDIHNLDR